MVKGRLDSEWWQTSYLLAAIRNQMQTDESKLVTPDDVNPRTPPRSRETRGLILTDAEFEQVFKQQIAGRRVKG